MKNHSLTLLTLVVIIASCISPEPALAGLDRTWTAVGDDGFGNGRATGYVMVLSQDSALIVDQNLTGGAWMPSVGLVVIPATSLPVPAEPGTTEHYSIPPELVSPGSWFASIKAFDDMDNYGEVGNIVGFEVDDTVSPAAILTLQ